MIEVRNLCKRYGTHTAVENLSFSVQQGEILGFLGPNGAGKSTTMNMITGYIGATDGTITVDGYDIFLHPTMVKSKIGYLPERPPLYLDMTVKEYLWFMFDLKKLKMPKHDHIEETCRLLGLIDLYPRMIKNLSKGYQQRVGLAQAMLGDPSVLILDEPTVGLDPKQIIEIRTLIQALGKKHTIILSSHILSEIQATCKRVIVMNRGHLIADDTPAHLSQTMSSGHQLTARIEGPKEKVLPQLQKLPHIHEVACLAMQEKGAFDYRIQSAPEQDVRRELFRCLAKHDWPLIGLHSSAPSLEHVFIQLTESEPSSAASNPQEGGPVS